MIDRRFIFIVTVIVFIGTLLYLYHVENNVFTNGIRNIYSKIDNANSKYSSNDKRNSQLLEKLEGYFENLTRTLNSQDKTLRQLVHLLNHNQTVAIEVGTLEEVSTKVDLFDLNKQLEPKQTYDSIECRKSAVIRGISTHLCLHDQSKDVFVSGSIRGYGVWEGHIVDDFLKGLQECPDCLVFDIGANIGQYGLYAARLGRKVISAEPFHDNILRLHKACNLENTCNKITLIKNAISDVRDRIMLLAKNDNNIGGQSLMNFKDKQFTKDDFKNPEYGRYLVRTILTDDLIDILPLNDNNQPYKKAIMKIDIETFEPYAFKNASNLFNKLEFLVIFMEFMHFAKSVEQHADVQNMINFLYDHGLKAYDKYTLLNRDTWKSNWPGDIVWRKI